MFSTLYYIVQVGFTTTSTVKAGVETASWTKKWTTKLWNMSAFNRSKKEKEINKVKN